jgi:hypothetical protein
VLGFDDLRTNEGGGVGEFGQQRLAETKRRKEKNGEGVGSAQS